MPVVAQQTPEERSHDLERALTIVELGVFNVNLLNQAATYSRRASYQFGPLVQLQPLRTVFARILAGDNSFTNRKIGVFNDFKVIKYANSRTFPLIKRLNPRTN